MQLLTVIHTIGSHQKRAQPTRLSSLLALAQAFGEIAVNVHLPRDIFRYRSLVVRKLSVAQISGGGKAFNVSAAQQRLNYLSARQILRN